MKILVALFVSVVLLLGPAVSPAEASRLAEPVCKVTTLSDTRALVRCVDALGLTLVQEVVRIPQGRTTTVPGPTVTLPPLPRATRTVKVPVPGPTATVTNPRDPRTITVSPSPRPVPTKTVSVPAPTVTVTETPSVGPIDTTHKRTVILRGPSRTKVIGYSALTLLGVVGLIILGLWLGYILGYKDKEREEMKFLDALRDKFYTRANK